MIFNPLKYISKRFRLTSFLVAIIIILFTICNVSFSQGRRDRINNNSNYVKTLTDTSKSLSDSSLALDSTRFQPVDSTARLKYFKYDPTYLFGTRLSPKSSPLLLDNSTNIEYKVSFDSSGNAIVHEKFGDYDIRAPLVIPMDKYLSEMSQNNLKKVFGDIVAEKFRGNTQDDISRLFEKFTDITIP